jgi:Tol biopolymer transport system component
MNADGSNRHILVPYETSPYRFGIEPAWSPDGTKISFVEFRMVNYPDFTVSIWVMNADGSNQVKLYESNNPGADDADGMYPTWSPDGTRLAFEHWQLANGLFLNQIYIMNSNGSNARCVTCNDQSYGANHQVPR